MNRHFSSAGPSPAVGSAATCTSHTPTLLDGKSGIPVRPSVARLRETRLDLDSDCPLGCRPPHEPSVELDRPLVPLAVRIWLAAGITAALIVWGVLS